MNERMMSDEEFERLTYREEDRNLVVREARRARAHEAELEAEIARLKSPGPTPAERLVMARNWERPK